MMRNSVSTLRVANNIFFSEVKEILSSGNDVLFTINGKSMRPFLSHGDKVLISPVGRNNLKIGKIILAHSQFGYVLHRLIWKNNKKIWLAGDNNLVQIEVINNEDILGYVNYAEINGEKVNVQGLGHVFLALLWFLARPFRLLIFKILRLFR